ncbi:MAG: nuclear transport factor 2 family protein [Bacteroides sp.]|nr:nuclear transport factor 2 family protein [Bacteroides sp.]MCM1390471.1 nuclear transport factor 2 family protein [Bacteroides sp.]
MKKLLSISLILILSSAGGINAAPDEAGWNAESAAAYFKYLEGMSEVYGAPMAVDEYGKDVTFQFSDGISSPQLKQKMEQQMSQLLTNLNKAAYNNADVNYAGLDIDNLASQTIGMTWNNVHFTTEEDFIVDHCLTIKSGGRVSGYQVRNIGVNMLPINDTYGGPMRKELCIDFNSAGKIIDFNFTMDKTNYVNIMKEGLRLKDEDRRMMIIGWCQQFEKAYCDKNIRFIEDVFSDDALIITGKLVTQRVKNDVMPQNGVVFEQKGKKEYIAGLKRVFANNQRLKVKFDDYRVVRHPAKPDYYGVTLKQDWHSDSYSDQGSVFLLWDFTDEDHPKIHVRTWEPGIECSFKATDFKI